MLDAEQFNYAEHNTMAGGLNLALHHHSDKPMMQFSSQLISTGLETHINVKPILSYTTENAISMLSPEERKCYSNSEANLTYLPFSSGYRYEMNNCLTDDAIGYIIRHCHCYPGFYPNNIALSPDFSDEAKTNITCSNERLECAIKKMKSNF